MQPQDPPTEAPEGQKMAGGGPQEAPKTQSAFQEPLVV